MDKTNTTEFSIYNINILLPKTQPILISFNYCQSTKEICQTG